MILQRVPSQLNQIHNRVWVFLTGSLSIPLPCRLLVKLFVAHVKGRMFRYLPLGEEA